MASDDLYRALLDATGPLKPGMVLSRTNVNAPWAALRAVVELHAPCTFLRRPLTTPICETCSSDDNLHDVPWPCSTIRTIAEELGVHTDEGQDRG